MKGKTHSVLQITFCLISLYIVLSKCEEDANTISSPDDEHNVQTLEENDHHDTSAQENQAGDDKTETSLEIPYYPEDGIWDREVYTARHFDDLVLPSTYTSELVQHATMLVLYTPDCSVEEEDTLSDLPPQVYMYYIKHDWQTAPLHIPYPLQGHKYSLYDRYSPQHCPTILYFPKDRSVYDPDVYFKNGSQPLSLNEWIWNKLLIKISVHNTVKGSVLLTFTGPGPAFDNVVIHAGDSLDLDIFASYLLTVTWYIEDESQPKFLLGKELQLSDNNTDIIIKEDNYDHVSGSTYSEKDWLLQKQADIWKLEDEIQQHQFNLAELYLMSFKQAILLPKFTRIGYEKLPMPEGFEEALLSYYEERSDQREAEAWSLSPVINDKEVKCTVVPLVDEIKDLIFSVLKPIAEKWCGQTLRPTAIYGIREYHHGNILRHHVDRPATHVISVLLPIYIKNNGSLDPSTVSSSQYNWPFELFNHLGMEQDLNLTMGEMLLYESASVIHGRSKPYLGEVYASAYVHFQPEYDWFWSEKILGKNQRRFLVNGLNFEFMEPLYAFATEATKRRHIRFYQDEL